MVFACKKCKKVFRKDMTYIFNIFSNYEEADEYCPNCDNHYVIDAETPETKAIREGKGNLIIGVDGISGENKEEPANMREKLLQQMLAEDEDF